MEKTCDYLVIGGGAAGCIVARRLADCGHHVILLEAGKPDEGDPAATDLARLDEQDGSYDWGYLAQTMAAAPQKIEYARAKLLGGCANHNDCAFIAPPADDFRRWRDLGADGWDNETLARCFSRVEDCIHIEAAPAGTSLSRAFIDAAIDLGLPERNFREGVAAGAGWFPLNAKGRLRQSSSIAYLHPLGALPANLEVRAETLVTALTFDGLRVTGAQTDRGRLEARREVILCAGSINTPQLMMLSGIGPADHLQNLGIAVRQALPGVGRNLLDHVAANVAYETVSAVPAWQRTFCESTLLVRLDQTEATPDVLFHFVLKLREKYAGQELFAGTAQGVKLAPNVARPKSRGWVTLKSADPRDKPVIALNYLSDREAYDRKTLIGGLRFARRLAQTPSLAPLLRREIAPGPEITGDEALFEYICGTCETVYHPAGTCRMGRDSDDHAVLLPDLRVKGIQGLRVADASVFPDMVTVNICNTVMMVAERAAELILAEA